MSKIEPIKATSDNRDEVYRLLNMVHAMAGSMANAKIGGWQLAQTYSSSHQMITVWTNGIVDVKADSRGDHHVYSMYASEQGESE